MTIFTVFTIMLSAFLLSGILLGCRYAYSHYTDRNYAQSYYTERHRARCIYALGHSAGCGITDGGYSSCFSECHYAERNYAEYCDAFA
jgi:hypothetical protein